MAELKL